MNAFLPVWIKDFGSFSGGRSLMFAGVIVAALATPALGATTDVLLATDKAFSAMSAEKGQHAAFLAFMTEDGRLYQGEHPPILGKAAAAAAFAAAEKADPTYANQKLVWTPLEAEASPDGALGYTRGTWIFTAPKAGGSLTLTGNYVTEWRQGADGHYKFCLDIGGADMPAAQ